MTCFCLRQNVTQNETKYAEVTVFQQMKHRCLNHHLNSNSIFYLRKRRIIYFYFFSICVFDIFQRVKRRHDV